MDGNVIAIMVIEEDKIIGNEEEPKLEVRSARMSVTGEGAAVALLLLILLLGAYFRFTGLNWDQDQHLHPDERFLTGVAVGLETVSDPLTYLRTSESPLNPYNLNNVPLYVYGNFPMTVTRYVAEWVNGVCTALPGVCDYNYTAYDGINLVGRALSAVFDLLSIAFIFLVGRRLYDWRTGVLAALLLAAAVMPIQQSHFFTMDNWAAALTTASLYAAVRAADNGRRKRWWIVFGLFVGLAVASRINVAPVAGMAGVAAIIWLARRERALSPGAGWRYVLSEQGGVDLQRAVLGVLLAALVSLATFRLAQPYAFADATIVRNTALETTGREASAIRVALGSVFGFNPQWRANMTEIQNLQSPEATFPPALQWTGRTALLFPLTNLILYGTGLAAGLAGLLGFFWALWRLLRLRPDWTNHALPVIWTGGYFLFMGTRWVKSIRYFLPIYPFLLLLAAWLLVTLWQRAGDNRARRVFAALLALAVAVPTLLWANAFVTIYREPMTRIAASRWMLDNIPTGATLLYEADGQQEAYQLPLKGYEFDEGGRPLALSFILPRQGTVTGVRFNYLSTPTGGSGRALLSFDLLDADGTPLLEDVDDNSAFELGASERAITFDLPPTRLAAGTPYVLRAQAEWPASTPFPIVADTSRIVNEEWDDLLPVNVDGKAAYAAYFSEVSGGQRPVTWPASAEKRELMLQWIDEADVIALSSQRSLWSTPRLPLTYPLNIAYYESLFNGDLGFDLVATFQGDLHVGPLYVSDVGGVLGWGSPPEVGWPPPSELAAEEAFSIYDHPPVWIFRKSERYAPEHARRLLETVDLSQVIVMNPGEASEAPNALMLTTHEEALQQRYGTFVELFNMDGILSRNSAVAAVVWWLTVFAIGAIAFPFAFVAFPGLAGRGYAMARVLGILVVSWFGWFLASYELLPNTRETLLLGLLLLAFLSFLLFLRRRQEMVAFVHNHLGYVAVIELLGASLFLLAIVIRLGNPDVWDVIWGGEKPMDLAYFTAVLKSTTFPPYDPWFAGGYINYYYYGFVFVGVVAKLLGIVPTVAYNLILPMLFSFTGLGVFAIAYTLVHHLQTRVAGGSTGGARGLFAGVSRKAVTAGLVAVLLAIIVGNLGELGVLLGAWHRAGSADINTGIAVVDATLRTVDGAIAVTIGGEPAPIYPGDWFWTATRAINAAEGEAAPITEFPFFTFLYGDLHAHMIALPLTMLALAWAVSLALNGAGSSAPERRDYLGRALLWFTGALVIGVLRPTNTWDWPTYLFLGCLAVAFATLVREGFHVSLSLAGEIGLKIVALAAFSTLLFWPYIAHYGAGYESLQLWKGTYTHLANYLIVYGLFLFLILTHLAREFRAWTETWTVAGMARRKPLAVPLLLALFIYVLVIFAAYRLDYWIIPIVLTLTVLAGVLALRPNLPAPRRILLTLIASALGLSMLVEVVVLEGDIGRMNTVFKFYMQVWMMLSIAGGAAFALVLPGLRRRSRPVRRLWQGALALLVAIALLYPLLATRAKWEIRMSDEAPYTLDGMVFMKTTSYGDTALDGSSQTIALDAEYEALRWMQHNVSGSPVIAEAHSRNPYRSIANRVAMYTGLPAIVGWDWHQRQQRAVVPDGLIWDRVDDVGRLYNTTSAAEAMAILHRYDVRYVYVGQLEWTYYRPQGLLKFDQMAADGELQEVFRNEGVSIYEVVS